MTALRLRRLVTCGLMIIPALLEHRWSACGMHVQAAWTPQTCWDLRWDCCAECDLTHCVGDLSHCHWDELR